MIRAKVYTQEDYICLHGLAEMTYIYHCKSWSVDGIIMFQACFICWGTVFFLSFENNNTMLPKKQEKVTRCYWCLIRNDCDSLILSIFCMGKTPVNSNNYTRRKKNFLQQCQLKQVHY